MKFSVGQKVWVLQNKKHPALPVGTHAGVVMATMPEGQMGSSGKINHYRVQVEGRPSPNYDRNWLSQEKFLSPRDDENRQITQWDLCIWQPKLLKVGA